MIQGTHVLRLGFKHEGMKIRCDMEQIDALLNTTQQDGRYCIDGVTSAGTSSKAYVFLADIKTITVIEVPADHWIAKSGGPGGVSASPIRSIQ